MMTSSTTTTTTATTSAVSGLASTPSTNSSPSSESGFQKYRQFMFFKNYHSKKKTNDSVADSVSTTTPTARMECSNVVVVDTTSSTSSTNHKSQSRTTTRNLLRQKSTSLHSLIDEKVNPKPIRSDHNTNASASGSTSFGKVAGNLTKNLNSKFKFYRKYSLKN